MMTLGSGTKGYFGKKKQTTYPPQGVRCQKCLEYGHWSYECKGKRKYVHRSSRTQVLKKKIKIIEEKQSKTITDGSMTVNNAELGNEKGEISGTSSTSDSAEEDSSSDTDSSSKEDSSSESSSSNSTSSADTSTSSSDSE